MILVDTSVGVDHLRSGLTPLANLLQEGEVLIHPWVIGEIAYGNLRNRQQALNLRQGLPTALLASDSEVLLPIERSKLIGRAISDGDAHLLAAAKLSRHGLGTQGQRLAGLAQEQGLAGPEDGSVWALIVSIPTAIRESKIAKN